MKSSEWINRLSEVNNPPPTYLYSFIGWALNGSFSVLLITGAASILTGAIEVLSAVFLGLLIDAALASSIESPLYQQLWLPIVGVIFFLVLRPLAIGFSSYMQSVVVAPNVFHLTLSRLHRWTLGQSTRFFENDFAGRIAQKEMQTARAITDVVVDVFQTVLFALASVSGAILMLTSINVSLAIALLVWLLIYLLLIRFFMPLIRRRSAERAGARASVTGQIVDTVTNIKTVKLFAHDKHEDRAALNSMDGFRKASVDYGRISAWFRFSLNGLAGGLPVIMVGGSVLFWDAGEVTAGEIAAIGAISLRLAQMTGWVSYTLMTLYANLGEIEDGISTLTPPHDLIDLPNSKSLVINSGRIDFEDIRFTYDRGIAGVNDISLTLKAGEKVGIVGASGAGKSTLVSLLLRLYDPETGSVKIDGQDLRGVTQESLRRQIGMVTQETALFNRSARDNILYGKSNAAEEELIDAAKQAEAHEFILDLKDNYGREGYQAHLGEQGVKLSGGQRQRIALARAILKDAPILVLDEATSALDSEVESAIQSALERVMQGKTVLAIAHRLSTLSKMDKIIVIDKGRIKEEGSHQQLLDLEGLYFSYWKRQSGGFIETRVAAE